MDGSQAEKAVFGGADAGDGIISSVEQHIFFYYHDMLYGRLPDMEKVKINYERI